MKSEKCAGHQEREPYKRKILLQILEPARRENKCFSIFILSPSMEEDSEVHSGGLKDLHDLQPFEFDFPPTHKTYSKQCSMVVIRDSSPENHADDDFSIFPPSNHENLIPSRFNLQSKNHPTPPQSLPSSPLPFLRPDFDPSPSPPEVTLLPNWWGFAFKILRSRIANIGSYFGSNSSGTKRSFWSFGNVALAVTVVLWWLYVRVRRQRRRSESVKNLMQIISEKDEVRSFLFLLDVFV